MDGGGISGEGGLHHHASRTPLLGEWEDGGLGGGAYSGALRRKHVR